MSEQKTDILIDELTADLCPCTKLLCHPLLRMMFWAVPALSYALLITFYLGIRPDLGHKAQDLAFLFEVGLAGFITLSAALASLWMSIPDMREQKWMLALPLTGAALFLFWSGIRFATEGGSLPHMHWDHCFQDGALIGLLPMAALVVMMRRGATTTPLLMSAMNVLAVGGVAYIALRFTCMMDTVGHGGMIHILPFIALGLVMGLLSRLVYRW